MSEARVWNGWLAGNANAEEPHPISRGNQRNLLDHPIRRAIVTIIKAEPGIKITNLCRETGAGWGTVQHHLNLLKKANLIVSRSSGRDCLLFSSDFPAEELSVTEALRRGRAERLAEAIAQSPGASQKELCTRVNMTRKIIRRYVELLSRAGLVSERRESRFQRYYPNPLLTKHLHVGVTGPTNGTVVAAPVETEAPPAPTATLTTNPPGQP